MGKPLGSESSDDDVSTDGDVDDVSMEEMMDAEWDPKDFAPFLVEAMEGFETDPNMVILELHNNLIMHTREYFPKIVLKHWFKRLRWGWAQTPPKTPSEVMQLVMDAFKKLHPTPEYGVGLKRIWRTYGLPDCKLLNSFKAMGICSEGNIPNWGRPARIAGEYFGDAGYVEAMMNVESEPKVFACLLVEDLNKSGGDPKVLDELISFGHTRTKVVRWFETLRKLWKGNPPKTPLEATGLVSQVVTKTKQNHCHTHVADLEEFLLFYGLPHYALLGRPIDFLISSREQDPDPDDGGRPGITKYYRLKGKMSQKSDPKVFAPLLLQALQKFDSHEEVVEVLLSSYVYCGNENLKRWFKKLRKLWLRTPPNSLIGATELVTLTNKLAYQGIDCVFDREEFLVFYGLPHDSLLRPPDYSLHSRIRSPQSVWLATRSNNYFKAKMNLKDEPKKFAPLLFMALQQFDRDPEYLEQLGRYVSCSYYTCEQWLHKLRKLWKKRPPSTPLQATQLAQRAIRKVNKSFFHDHGLEGFAFLYNLPHESLLKRQENGDSSCLLDT